MASRDLRWLEVTQKWRQLIGRYLEVAVENQELTYLVHFTSYKADGRGRRQSRDRKWCHLTSGDRTWNWTDVTTASNLEVAVGQNPRTLYIHFLQGCSSQEEAFMWQEMTSRDLRWPEATRKWRHLTRSYLEVAVEYQKLAYAIHYSSYKAVARRKRQLRDKKWRPVTSGDRKWPASDVIWLEVTRKWL